jgi:hypothetical protein
VAAMKLGLLTVEVELGRESPRKKVRSTFMTGR